MTMLSRIPRPVIVVTVALAVAAGWLIAFGPSQSAFASLKYAYYGLLIVLPVMILASTAYSGLRGHTWTRNHTLATICAAGLLATYTWATHIEPYWLQVRTVKIDDEAVSEPLRIVHISDIQTPSIGPYERRVFDTIGGLHPDLVIHTGDLLQPATDAELDKLARLFAALEPTYGVYNVPGDVDRSLSTAQWARFDAAADITTLFDETTTIDTPTTEVRILGLDRRDSRMVRPQTVRRWLDAGRTAKSLDIVIGHAPDYMLNIRGQSVDLALAGHTHGGQIRIPLYGPPLTLSNVPRQWAFGHTLVDGTHLDVTSGIGAERAHGLPPIRLNAPPEVVLIVVE